MICKFFCPHCGQHISAEGDVQGTSVNCPACGGEFIAPLSIAPSLTPETEPQPTAPPQPESSPPAAPLPQPGTPLSNSFAIKADIARFLSARMLFWFSVSLWIVACGAVAFALAGATFNDRGAAINDKAIEKLIGAIGRVLIGAGALAWAFRRRSGKPRGYSFLTFSVVCAAAALYFAFVVRSSVRQQKPRSQEASQRIVANMSEFFDQAASGGLPTMKPTGEAGIDAAIPAMNAFSQDLFGYLNRMEDEIDALHRGDVFSISILSKEAIMTSEIRKAVASQNIIERYKSGFQPMIEAALTKYGKLRTSGESYKAAAAVEQFRKTVGANLRRYDEMFSIRLRRQKAELDFLSFMHGAFNDYHFAEKVISFKTPSNNQRYKELVQGIDDAEKEAVAYEKRQSEAVEAAKAQIQSLAH